MNMQLYVLKYLEKTNGKGEGRYGYSETWAMPLSKIILEMQQYI